MKPATKTSAAFTLVEMLVVMIILALAVALAVGVSADVAKHTKNETTRNIQSLTIQALAVYKRTFGEYPPGDGSEQSSAALIRALTALPTSRGVLAKLPKDALKYDLDGNEILVDGFGREIKYDATGGLAGRNPALTSMGENPDDPTDDIEIGM